MTYYDLISGVRHMFGKPTFIILPYALQVEWMTQLPVRETLDNHAQQHS